MAEVVWPTMIEPSGCGKGIDSPTDGPATLQAAGSGQTTIDRAQLQKGPVTVTYPVDYTDCAQDGAGSVDHITASATETIGLASS